MLKHHLLLVYGAEAVSFAEKDGNKTEIIVMGKITLTHNDSEKTILLEWSANAENDMWADSIVTTLFQVEASPETVKLSQSGSCGHSSHNHEHDESALKQRLQQHLEDVFGKCVLSENGSELTVHVDDMTCNVKLPSYETESENKLLRKSVLQATKRFVATVKPLAS